MNAATMLSSVLGNFIRNSHAAIKRERLPTSSTHGKIVKDWSLAPGNVLHHLDPNRNLWSVIRPRKLTLDSRLHAIR